jgi:phosphatidylserine decarboxylase
VLSFLYKTVPGRAVLKVVCARWVSAAVGKFMDSPLSKPIIKSFVKKNGIDLSEFESDGFTCFNDCFCRRIKEGRRPISEDKNALISPCDGLLSAYRITPDTTLDIKGSIYRISDLVNSTLLAEKYADGVCLVFRLCVNHYHRYIYVDSGSKGGNVFIPGKLHTVRPIALEALPVFVRNCREYTVMDTESFGEVIQIEVGALLVGKIANHHGEYKFTRGEEKGSFLYGGSTIIMLLHKDAAEVDEKYFAATENGEETDVKMGEKIGSKPD